MGQKEKKKGKKSEEEKEAEKAANPNRESVASTDSYDADEDFTKPPAPEWKPAKFVSYETMGLCKTADNPVMRPCGFRKDG